MKKFLPFLWLLPILALICIGTMLILDFYDMGSYSDLVSIVVGMLCWLIQLMVPVMYYCKRGSLPLYVTMFIVTVAVLLAFTIFEFFDRDMWLIMYVPTVCSALCIYTLARTDKKQEKNVNSKSEAPTPVVPAKAVDAQTPVAAVPLEELKQLKELLDMGAITQEEYDMKKKQLLGL